MDDHLPDGFPGDIGAMVGQAMGQMRAALEDVMTERYQYKRVGWEEVNDLARCQCRMGRHWTHDARCQDCGCKGWLAA